MAGGGSNSSSVASGWTSTQAYVMAVVCLAMGVAVGYLLRASTIGDEPKSAVVAKTSVPAGIQQQQITPEQMKHAADKQAEPMLAQLKTTPHDSALLAKIGNIYYDMQQYRDAIAYYERSLKVDSKNVDVRADMATCYWYTGDAEKAVLNYEKGLALKPDHANILFNLGVVKWEGKLDPSGALQAWETLLKTNPNFQDKAKVQELIARARQHVNTGASGRLPKS